jgi:ligand-binding sensor protein
MTTMESLVAYLKVTSFIASVKKEPLSLSSLTSFTPFCALVRCTGQARRLIRIHCLSGYGEYGREISICHFLDR